MNYFSLNMRVKTTLLAITLAFVSWQQVNAQSSWKVRSDVLLPAPASSLAYSPDGSRLAIGHSNGTVTVWSMVDRSKVADFSAGKLPIGGLQFTRDGGQIITLADEKMVRVWNVTDGKTLGEFDGVAFSFALSPDGQLLVGQMPDQSIWL